jgi:DNA-binding NarL/FixJ family response regulator
MEGFERLAIRILTTIERVMGVGILIADDHEFVRKGLIGILGRSHPEWHVVGEVSTGSAAIEIGTTLRPDVAILDLFMPDLIGSEVAARLLESVPGIRIIILSMYAAEPIQRQLRKAGVHAYLAKNEAPRMLPLAVERVLAGEPFFASSATSRSRLEAPEYIPVQFLLTARELEVFRLLARGRSNKEVATDLDLGVRTVESHHAHIVAKLNAKSLADLVRIAVRDGVI